MELRCRSGAVVVIVIVVRGVRAVILLWSRYGGVVTSWSSCCFTYGVEAELLDETMIRGTPTYVHSRLRRPLADPRKETRRRYESTTPKTRVW